MLRRLIVALAVAILAEASLAQAPAKPPYNSDATKNQPGNCTVGGRVVSAADGAPLRSARVGLVQANVHRHPLVYATATDNQGHFELKQVEAGRYEFFASHIGYLTQQYQAKGTDEGAVLSLVSGQEVSDVLFSLVRAAVITGRVVDDGGEPMMDVNVSVLRRPSEEEKEDEGPRARRQELVAETAGTTDDRGEYRIFGLKPGEYYVKAAETGSPYGGPHTAGGDAIVQHELGSQYAPLFYPGVLQTDQAQTVTLRAGEEMHADFAMRRVKLVGIAGRVIAPDGSPARRTFVRLSQPGVSDWGGELGSGADSEGEFSIKGVPPGSYILSAQMHDKDRFYSTRQKLEVGESKIDSITLAFGVGATIRGRLLAAGVAARPSGRNTVGVYMQSTLEDDEASHYAEVNKDGTFELDGVGDGSYALMVTGLEQGWFDKSAHVGSEDVLQKGVQVENGAATGNLEIVISSDGAQLEGTVSDSDKNQPLAGVQVKVKVDPETDYNHFRSHQASTDQNGHFVLKDVPPGKYKVSAKIPSPGGGASAIKSDAVAVTLGEREHRVLDFKLPVPKSE